MAWKLTVCLAVCWTLFRRIPAERHTLYWNSSNPSLLREGATIEVKLNDYLDINCPHYQQTVPPRSAERYTLYLVDREDYESCQPRSKEQVRWECKKPHAPHGPERFSEKFQRFTPFSLGKEFKEGHYYYYLSKPIHNHGESCLKMRVHVCCAKRTNPRILATKPSLPADQPEAVLPDTQRSTGSSTALVASHGLAFISSLCLLLL